MKTQRSRESTTRRPTPEVTADTTNGNGNGKDTHANSDGAESVSGTGMATNGKPVASTNTLPRLPKRNRVRPGAVEAAPSGAAATAVKDVPVAEAPEKPATDPGTALSGHVDENSEMPAEPRRAPKAWRAYITLENLFWVGLLVAVFFTRFYDIGNRALHHDESLHSVYSGNLYTGAGYTHDPMMHGPLQFHLIAFMYWLFGRANDSVRFASAFCGIFVVMSPFFLRRQMGRVAALICSFLLLVSPSILYFSRMAREDAIFSGMEMIMLVGLWRFISTRKPMDFYIFCAGLSLMFTIKETAYLTLAVLGGLFILLFAYQAGYAILGALVGYGAALGGVLLLVKSSSAPKLPDIPDTNPNFDTIKTFAVNLLTHPMVLGMLAVSLVFIAVLAVLFSSKKRSLAAAYDGANSNGAHVQDGSGEGVPVRKLHTHRGALRPNPEGILSHYEAGSLPHLVGSLFSRPRVLLIGFAVFATIFITFYSVFFTDVPRGILSGMFASLGYWIAQQGVARGGQPWFYYFLLLPLYEPIAIFFSLASAVFFSWKGVRWLLRNRAEQYETGTPHLSLFNTDRPVPFARFEAFLPLFLGWWLVGALFIYSWAGEKMPWLMMHMTRPAIFLSSLFLGGLLLAMLNARKARLANAGLLDGASDGYSEREDALTTVPQRRRRTAGAMFRLGVFGAFISANPVSSQKLAYEGLGANTTVQYRNGGRSANVPPAPPRRGGGVRAAAVAMPAVRYQDPPWVTLNRADSVAPFAIYLVMFMLLAFGWGLAMTQQTHWANDAANTSVDKWSSWWTTWLYPLAMMALTVAFAVWIGVGRSLRYLGVGIFSVFLIYEIHSAIQLTYRNPDVATELAVYVQTSPDVTRVMRELDTFSYMTTGGKDVKIIYDTDVSWPMEWYLRDYPNKQYIGAGTPQPGPDVPVMMVDYKYLNDQNLLKDYVAQRYALRWWFPEEWYKNDFLPNQFVKDANGAAITDPVTGKQKEESALSQVGEAFHTAGVTLFQPEYQAALWKYLIYREPPKPLGSTDFVLFIRKDVAQLWHNLQNAPIPSADIP